MMNLGGVPKVLLVGAQRKQQRLAEAGRRRAKIKAKRASKPAKRNFAPYAEYLQGNWWHARRRQKIKSVGGKCERCGDNRFLQVHHLHYDSLGREKNADLEVLCRACHEHEHGDLIDAKQHMAAIAAEECPC